jgi:hypothetical protein
LEVADEAVVGNERVVIHGSQVPSSQGSRVFSAAGSIEDISGRVRAFDAETPVPVPGVPDGLLMAERPLPRLGVQGSSCIRDLAQVITP